MEVCAIVLACIVFVALMSYQVTYSRLIFVSGLERHLPRIFTHLNPRTRNPVTAVLIQGVLSSLILVGLYSQSSMANVTVFLQGGLSIAWLISGFFFLFPVILARKKYADRYASEKFWRIPGGMVGVWITVLVGTLGTMGGIYYSFAKSWIKDVPDGTWMVWTGSIAVGMFAARRGRLHLRPPVRAQDLRGRRTGASRSTRVEGRSQMTMESTVPSTDAVDNASRYPLDPLTGAEIETAATVISDSEYATPTLKFVMIQLAEPDKTAELTFEGIVDVPQTGVRDHVRRRGQAGLRGGRRPRRACHRLVEVGAGPLPVLPRRAHDRRGRSGAGRCSLAGGDA